MIISMISAMGHDRVIGLNGSMPWHLPADLSHFKRSTMGSPVIMGRKTFDSIGKPLPGRRNIVLTRSSELLFPGCDIVSSLTDGLELVKNEAEVFIIGGQQLYQQGLPLSQRLYLTHIAGTFEGDTYFPNYSHIDWRQISLEQYEADAVNPWSYHFEVLERVSAPGE